MYEIFEKLLKEHNVTTYQVAKATGISTASFTGWKQGKWNFKQDKLQKIADFFNVDIDYLLGRTDKTTLLPESAGRYYTNHKTAEVAQEIFENKELRALFDVQRDMDPDDLKALHNMALALKRKERGNYDDTGC